MKRLSLILLFSLVCFSAVAQFGPVTHWMLGDSIHLEWHAGGVNATLTNATFVESTASFSDHQGNLLFFTNGVAVYDSAGNVMPNGTSILGCESSSTGAVIVPMPMNPNRYYLFTTGCFEQGFSQGANYHVIDMSLNGGLGDVVLKNETIGFQMAEQIAATYHSNNCDVWISYHKLGNDEFHTFLLTDSGLVNTAVVSQAGPPILNNGSTYGRTNLKFNRNGNLAAFAPRLAPGYGPAVLEFDRTTGMFSDYIQIPMHTHYYDSYFACLSPNDNLLYVTGKTNNTTFLAQYNLTLSTPQEMLDSLVILDDYPSGGGIVKHGQLQYGPDGELYESLYLFSYLSRIDNPDVPGLGANYTFAALNFPGAGNYGLPNFVSQYILPGSPVGCSPPLGMADRLDHQASLYPQPFREALNVAFDDEGLPGQYEFVLYDALGKAVSRQTAYGSPMRIERRGLPAGVYAYTLLRNGQLAASGKVVAQ